MSTDDGPRSRPDRGSDAEAATDPMSSGADVPFEDSIPDEADTPEDLKKTLRRAPTAEIEKARALYRARHQQGDPSARPSEEGPADDDGLDARPAPALPRPNPPPKRSPNGSIPPRPGDPPGAPDPNDDGHGAGTPNPEGDNSPGVDEPSSAEAAESAHSSQLDPPTVRVDRDSDGTPPGIPSLVDGGSADEVPPERKSSRGKRRRLGGKRKRGSRRRQRVTLKIPDDQVPAAKAAALEPHSQDEALEPAAEDQAESAPATSPAAEEAPSAVRTTTVVMDEPDAEAAADSVDLEDVEDVDDVEPESLEPEVLEVASENTPDSASAEVKPPRPPPPRKPSGTVVSEPDEDEEIPVDLEEPSSDAADTEPGTLEGAKGQGGSPSEQAPTGAAVPAPTATKPSAEPKAADEKPTGTKAAVDADDDDDHTERRRRDRAERSDEDEAPQPRKDAIEPAPISVVTDNQSVGLIMPVQISSDLPAVEPLQRKQPPLPPRRKGQEAPDSAEGLEELEPVPLTAEEMDALDETPVELVAGKPPLPETAEPTAAVSKRPPPPPKHKTRGAEGARLDESPEPPAATPPPPAAAAATPSPPPAKAAPDAAAGDAAPAAEAPPEAKPPPAKPKLVPKRKKAWWVELFEDDWLRTMDTPTQRDAAREVDFIERRLRLQPSSRVLDLACGQGRHAVELASRGYQVVGVDLSAGMLSVASDHALERGQRVNFVKGDMRKLSLDAVFDGIFCWSSSFGYFDDQTNINVLESIHRALRQGGMFALDVTNRDFVAPRSPTMVWFEQPGCVCMDEMKFDFYTSRMQVKRMVLFESGKSKELEYALRLYSLHELGRLLHQVGFKVLEVSGHRAHPGAYFGSESPRTIIVAERV